MAALERTIAYSKERVQFGGPLSEKQGYTHQLLVPNAVRLEAARAYIEKTAARLDSGEEDLQLEGSIAKYFATEAACKAADEATRIFGAYAYSLEYRPQRYYRDNRFLLYGGGTHEILQTNISRWVGL